jgi:hypothetical protein
VEKIVRKIKRIDTGCMVNLWGLRYYETRYYFDLEEVQERYNFHEISFTRLKDMGVIKTFNSTKKLETWLNSPKGKEWYANELNEKFEYERYVA